MEFRLNEQIAFLRKQKGITQEELAKVLGVTNQTVSKWEASQCCPDIQLLPDIAMFFGVTIDELMGYKPVKTFDHIYRQIKALFVNSPKEEAFTIAFKLATILHEGACSGGYKGYIPWDSNKNYTETEECYKWGSSICSEPEGVTVHKANSVFLTDNTITKQVTNSVIKEVYNVLENLCDKNTLNVLFGLYELTVHDFEIFVSLDAIKEKCKLSEDIVKKALDNIPVQIIEDEQGRSLYRMEGYFMHIPSLLLMFSS